jgi:stage V sporulation protein AF
MEQLKQQLREAIGYEQSFDIIFREMQFAGTDTAMLFVNGFAKDEVLTDLLMRLSWMRVEQGVRANLAFFKAYIIPHIQVEEVLPLDQIVVKVLAGGTAFFVEGEPGALLIDAKRFPMRSIEEPSLERVVRGSRDGFVEVLLTNAALVRRRIRDPKLKLEMMQIGRRSKTDVCISYISDIANDELVKAIKDKCQALDLDGLPMSEKQLDEWLLDKGWNPYPQVRYTERPDVVANHLLEGHVAVMVDTSPSVMILPATFFHFVQHAEEYRQTPFMGTYLRWVRFLGILASLFMVPFWYLVVKHPEFKPAVLHFIGPHKMGKLPILLQFLFAEIGVDLMRMAAVHTPTPLATAMGLIAAILIGDIAVQSGLFINEVILYMAVAAIGMFATPSYELGLANRATRLVLLIATAAFGIKGFMISSTLFILYLIMQTSFGAPYFWPLVPFDWKGVMNLVLRRPVQTQSERLVLTKPQDKIRQVTPK